MTDTTWRSIRSRTGSSSGPTTSTRRLRAAEPVHKSDLLQGWVLTRFEDIATLLKDPTLSVEVENALPNDITKGELERRHDEDDERGMTLVLLDDPEHARIRKLMAPPFRARSIEGWRDMIQAEVDVILDRILPPSGQAGEMDVLTDFAYPLPVTVFCKMLGFPDEDSPKFRHWTQCVAKNLDPVLTPEEREACTAGTDEMYEYLEQQIIAVQDEPRDDLLTQLVFATDDDGQRLTHGELLAQLITLYVAGHEPTTALIGNGLLGLLRQPDELAQLQGDIDGLLTERGSRAAAIRRTQPVRPSYRDARDPVRRGGRPARRRALRQPGRRQPRPRAVGCHRRRDRRGSARRQEPPPAGRWRPRVPGGPPGPRAGRSRPGRAPASVHRPPAGRRAHLVRAHGAAQRRHPPGDLHRHLSRIWGRTATAAVGGLPPDLAGRGGRGPACGAAGRAGRPRPRPGRVSARGPTRPASATASRRPG